MKNTTTTAPKLETSPLTAVMLLRAGFREGLDFPADAPCCRNLSHRCGCAIGHGLAKISRRAA